jgi:cobalamin biosynthesis Mg chelatase CobN
MPKRSSAARSGAQRQRPKAQKNIELVRPATSEPEPQAGESTPAAAMRAATATATTEKTAAKATATEPTQEKTTTEAPKAGSASARLAARRQGAQRAQQRNASSLITPEHFAYVRKDLIFIAVLAVIMVAAIIILYFTIGATA